MAWQHNVLEGHCGSGKHILHFRLFRIITVIRRPPWLGNTMFRRPRYWATCFTFKALQDQWSI